MNKSLINEDVDFIREYINTLMDRHPEIKDDEDIIKKLERRLNDIQRIVAE